jgi:hypothetical protein
MVLFSLWIYIRLIYLSKFLDVGKAVDEECMLCVERMAIHLVEGVNCRVCVSEFDKGISIRGST